MLARHRVTQAFSLHFVEFANIYKGNGYEARQTCFLLLFLFTGLALKVPHHNGFLNHVERTDQYKCSCYVIQPKTKHYAHLWCFYHKIQHLYQRHCISQSFITIPSATYGLLNGVLVSLYTPQTWVERDNTE